MLNGRYLSLILMIGFSAPAYADNTAAALGAGGLVPIKHAEISMTSEDLQISPHRIDVDYKFRNDTDHYVTTIVEFPLPMLDGGLIDHTEVNLPFPDKENFVDFHVAVEGKPVPTQLETRAFKDGQDVTDELAAAGLPTSVVDPRLNQAIENLPNIARKQLIDEGLLAMDGSNLWPWWESRSRFYWTQNFPAHSITDISHSYRPVAGGSYGDNRAGDILSANSCANKEQRAIAQKLTASGQDITTKISNTTIDFILITGNNWNGPIARFTLTLDTENPNDFAMTCMGELKKISPTKYQFTVTDLGLKKT